MFACPGWDPAPKGCCSNTALHPSLNRALFTASNSKTSMHPQPVCVGPTVTCVVAGAHPQAGTNHIRDQLQARAGDKDMVHKDRRRQRQDRSSSHHLASTPRASLPPPGFNYHVFPGLQATCICLPPSFPPSPSSFLCSHWAETPQHPLLITKGRAVPNIGPLFPG